MTETKQKYSKYNQMKNLENKLNGELGDIWWNKYISSAFWSNISTPINLAITILSAITAGQATTNNMLTKGLFLKISLASLLLSTLNTFFRPHSQLMTNMTAIKSINEFGAKFEVIYYSDCGTEEEYERRYLEYTALSQEFNKYQIGQSPEEQNFFTDLIYWIIKKNSILKNTYRWLDVDMIYLGQNQPIDSIQNNCCKPDSCSSCCIPSKESISNSVILPKVIEPNTITNLNTITYTNQDSNKLSKKMGIDIVGEKSKLNIELNDIESGLD